MRKEFGGKSGSEGGARISCAYIATFAGRDDTDGEEEEKVCGCEYGSDNYAGGIVVGCQLMSRVGWRGEAMLVRTFWSRRRKWLPPATRM